MITRRKFLGTILLGSVSAAFRAYGGPLSTATAPKPEVGLPPSGRLSTEDWQALRTLADAIIPATTKSVSSSQAGVLHYLDRALAGPYAASLPAYRELVALLKTFLPPHTGPSWKLEPAEAARETGRLEREHPEAFAMFRKHTLEGYFSAPRHGGNLGCRGWAVVRLKSHILPWKEVQEP